MPRSEYYEPTMLPGEREQPSIWVDSYELLKLMLRAEMMMTKVDRVRYADRAIKEIQDVRAEFRLAYDFEEDRREHLKKMCAHAGNFIDEISPEWWRWCHYDDRRKAIVANPGYTHNELLLQKYHFKLSKSKRNGNTGKNQRPRVAAA